MDPTNFLAAPRAVKPTHIKHASDEIDAFYQSVGALPRVRGLAFVRAIGGNLTSVAARVRQGRARTAMERSVPAE